MFEYKRGIDSEKEEGFFLTVNLGENLESN